LDIILDTNVIIHSGFLLRTPSFVALFDFIEKTKSQFVMTQLVWEELLGLYRKEVEKRHDSLEKARSKLASMLLEEGQGSKDTDFEVDPKIEKYKNFIKEKMGFSEVDIVSYHDHYLRDLVSRAINRGKPFTDKGEEFRDAVLWLTVLDVAESKETRTVVFISENTRQYAAAAQEKKSKTRVLANAPGTASRSLSEGTQYSLLSLSGQFP